MPSFTSQQALGAQQIIQPYGIGDGAVQRTQIRVPATIVHGSAFNTLTITLPARSRAVFAQLYAATTVPVTGANGANGTADGYVLIQGVGTATQPVTGSSVSAITNEIIRQTATTSAAVANGGQGGFTTNLGIIPVNTATTTVNLFIMPLANSGTSQICYLTNGVVSNAYFFGTSSAANTSATYGVLVYVDVETYAAIDVTN